MLPGNVTAEEAADLTNRAGVATVVPMHFDMFTRYTEKIESTRSAERRLR